MRTAFIQVLTDASVVAEEFRLLVRDAQRIGDRLVTQDVAPGILILTNVPETYAEAEEEVDSFFRPRVSVHLVEKPTGLRPFVAKHSDLVGVINLCHPRYEIPDSFIACMDLIVQDDGLHLVRQRDGEIALHDKADAAEWKREIGPLFDSHVMSCGFAILKRNVLTR